MPKPSKATAVVHTPEMQGLIRIIAAFGPSGYDAAVALVSVKWDYKRAAIFLGVSEEVVRQRVFRLSNRAQKIMGPLGGYDIPVRKRPKTLHGDWEGPDGRTLFERQGV